MRTYLKYVCSKIFRSCRKYRLSSQIHSSSSLFNKCLNGVVVIDGEVVFFVEFVELVDAANAIVLLLASIVLQSLPLLVSISHLLCSST